MRIAVISLNVKRRHLNESQRAMIAAKIATLRPGANQHRPIGLPSQAAAAALLNVSRRSVARATKLLNDAAPSTVEAVERGL